MSVSGRPSRPVFCHASFNNCAIYKSERLLRVGFSLFLVLTLVVQTGDRCLWSGPGEAGWGSGVAARPGCAARALRDLGGSACAWRPHRARAELQRLLARQGVRYERQPGFRDPVDCVRTPAYLCVHPVCLETTARFSLPA